MSELASDTAAAGDAPEQRLRQTIDLIGEDVALIELWAVALSSFAQPAPHYDFGKPSERDSRRS